MSQGPTRRAVIAAGSLLILGGCLREPLPPPPIAAGGADPAPPPDAADGLWYVVAAGDTLSAISRRSGVPLATIVETNRLPSAALAPGQRLWLPGAVAIAPPVPSAPEAPAAGDPYRLVPRSAWTDRPVGGNHVALGKVLRLTLHHTDEHGPMSSLPDTEVIRRIENYHRSPPPHGRGWAAIGYHYLVGRDGTIYEGRPARFQGAHVSGNNENNLGISVIGDYSARSPSPRQGRALAAFLDDCRRRHQVPIGKVYGHRDLRPTVCPGDGLYAWLKRYRAGAA